MFSVWIKIVRIPPIPRILEGEANGLAYSTDGLHADEIAGVLERVCNDREQEGVVVDARIDLTNKFGNFASLGAE